MTENEKIKLKCLELAVSRELDVPILVAARGFYNFVKENSGHKNGGNKVIDAANRFRIVG
jgi:hypothetical protein